MTRKELDRLRILLSKTRDSLALIGRGEIDLFLVSQNILAIEGALRVTDPDRPRQTTPLGARILEAAGEVGFDAHRLDRALKDVLPSGTLTRLLHHDVQRVRRDVIERIAELLGCQFDWLLTGIGERRRAPPHPGVAIARVFGASEDAIRTVMTRDAGISDRDEHAWLIAFLAESKRLSAAPADSATRMR